MQKNAKYYTQRQNPWPFHYLRSLNLNLKKQLLKRNICFHQTYFLSLFTAGLWQACFDGFHDKGHQYEVTFNGCKHILLEEYDIIRYEVAKRKYLRFLYSDYRQKVHDSKFIIKFISKKVECIKCHFMIQLLSLWIPFVDKPVSHGIKFTRSVQHNVVTSRGDQLQVGPENVEIER